MLPYHFLPIFGLETFNYSAAKKPKWFYFSIHIVNRKEDIKSSISRGSFDKVERPPHCERLNREIDLLEISELIVPWAVPSDYWFLYKIFKLSVKLYASWCTCPQSNWPLLQGMAWLKRYLAYSSRLPYLYFYKLIPKFAYKTSKPLIQKYCRYQSFPMRSWHLLPW